MHDIRFPYPGYIRSEMPSAYPDRTRWQHFIWTFDALEQYAEQAWAQDEAAGLGDVIVQVRDYLQIHGADLKKAYEEPTFTHGDCHAHQFFVANTAGTWDVTGICDMEVSSAGDCGNDLVKFTLEMAGLFSASTAWWQPFLEGYGNAYPFELHKLRMLMAGPENYWPWPGSRRAILEHLLKATSWEELFDVQRIEKGSG